MADTPKPISLAEYRRKGKHNPYEITESYQPTDFYMAATDRQGHSRHMRLALPPTILGAIEAIVATKEWPYRTAADLVRDAVIHRIKTLADMNGDESVLRALKLQMATDKMLKRQGEVEAAAGLVQGAKEAFDVAKQAKDWVTMSDLYRDLVEIVDELHEPYKGELAGLVDEMNRLLKANTPDEDE